jgi:hypothetical protein
MTRNILRSFSQVLYIFPFRNTADVLMEVQLSLQDVVLLLYVWYHTNRQIINVVRKWRHVDGFLY